MGKIVISLFDGMGCAALAFKDAGIEVDKYYCSEIDKKAIETTKITFPEHIHLGSVSNVRYEKGILYSDNGNFDVPHVDFVVGGSPCQGFSFAGKGLNFEDPRSKLFFEYVRILNEVKAENPNVYFLLENVQMKIQHNQVITSYMGVEPLTINSALVSAQNRVRLYWTNIGAEIDGLFGDLVCTIPQPKDEGILLKHILQDDVDEKYYLKTPKDGFNGMDIHSKSNTLRTGGHQSQSDKHNFDIIKVDKQLNPKPNQDKASCFTAGGHSGGNHSDMDLLLESSYRQDAPTSIDKDKHPCLGTEAGGKTKGIGIIVPEATAKDNLVFTQNYVQYDVSGKGYKSQQDRAFYEDGKHGCLATSRAETKSGVFLSNFRIRRLTPIECCRLQTVPDDYFYKDGKQIVSDSAIYKMLGNGWNIKTISHILKFSK